MKSLLFATCCIAFSMILAIAAPRQTKEREQLIQNVVGAAENYGHQHSGKPTDADVDTLLAPYILPKTADENGNGFKTRQKFLRQFARHIIRDAQATGLKLKVLDIAPATDNDTAHAGFPGGLVWSIEYQSPPPYKPDLVSMKWVFKVVDASLADPKATGWRIEATQAIPTHKIN